MARITVEDCLDQVENRFQLVLAAAKRARQLSMGHEPLVSWDDDKPTVVALREISENKLDIKMLLGITPEPKSDLALEFADQSTDEAIAEAFADEAISHGVVDMDDSTSAPDDQVPEEGQKYDDDQEAL